MALLLGTDVPSRSGINNAIQSTMDEHASTTTSTSLHYDSGWIALPLRAGFVVSGETPRYRRIGDIVFIMGRIAPSGGGNFATGQYAVADLPAGFRPTIGLVMFPLMGSTGGAGRLWYDTSGVVNCHVATASNSHLSLAGTIARNG